MSKRSERVRFRLEFTYYLRRRLVRFVTLLEIPARWARRWLEKTDATDPGGRKHDLGSDANGRDRRKH